MSRDFDAGDGSSQIHIDYAPPSAERDPPYVGIGISQIREGRNSGYREVFNTWIPPELARKIAGEILARARAAEDAGAPVVVADMMIELGLGLTALDDLRKLLEERAEGEPVLCYVSWPDDTMREKAAAYFTTRKLALQWGDDWNDAPYEHNAGSPYPAREGEDWEIWRVEFRASWDSLRSPECFARDGNSWISVQDINQRKAQPWLRDVDSKIRVWAGTPMREVIDLLRKLNLEPSEPERYPSQSEDTSAVGDLRVPVEHLRRRAAELGIILGDASPVQLTRLFMALGASVEAAAAAVAQLVGATERTADAIARAAAAAGIQIFEEEVEHDLRAATAALAGSEVVVLGTVGVDGTSLPDRMLRGTAGEPLTAGERVAVGPDGLIWRALTPAEHAQRLIDRYGQRHQPLMFDAEIPTEHPLVGEELGHVFAVEDGAPTRRIDLEITGRVFGAVGASVWLSLFVVIDPPPTEGERSALCLRLAQTFGALRVRRRDYSGEQLWVLQSGRIDHVGRMIDAPGGGQPVRVLPGGDSDR